MYPDFAYKINDRFELMPLVLRIVCGATFMLGVFQLVAIPFPFLSPSIEGVTISSTILMILMGGFHLIIGWGVYSKQKWSIPLIIILPIFQYNILYLDKGLSEEALKTNFVFVGIWSIFFITYFVLGRTKSYFGSQKNA